MTTKKKTSSTKKTAKGTKKKLISKKTSSVKKKVSSSKKKSTTSKKKSPAKAKAKTKPKAKKPARKTVKKKTTIKKAKNSIPDDGLFVMTMNETESEKKLHVFPESRTLIQQLPVVDLDKLHQYDPVPAPEPEEEVVVTHVAVRSRVAFYLGVFLGAVVVNVFLVTILAVMST